RGIFQSLRIDHVDGLYNPKQYLERLRGLVGDDTYIIVEKILEPNEYLPADWPCQGTSGYDFLSLVNRLLINDRTADSLSEFYQQMHVMAYDFTEAVYRKKLFMLIHHMGGELDNLTRQLVELFPEYTPSDEMRVAYRQVMAYWLVSFPVYRLYLDETSLSEENAKALAQVFAEARTKAPESLGETFDQLRPLLAPEPAEATSKQMRFLMRTQQFTGPLMAKGVEDTAFYVYNRLISRNEVGDTPHVEENMNVNRFHAEMRKRQPHTMNTTATHDTKRGEDARLRINVLSELPDEWREKVLQWQDTAHRYRAEEAGKTMPDPNDEYFIYQTLIGTYPLHAEPENEAYVPRLKDYLTKVMKEAKVHTSWSKPDEVYEGKVTGFVENLLADGDFLASFLPFAEKVARYGALYSLVQVLIRLTAPGIPDTYQGTEFWDLSMVDPDNRRPVDYKTRQNVLENVLPRYQDAEKLAATLTDVLNPALKMHVLHQLLLLRRQQPKVFLHGDYRPLVTAGRRARQVAGYVRHYESRKVLVLFPLEVSALCSPESLPVGEAVWEDTYIGWEEENATYTNIFTGEQLQLTARQPVAALLGRFPVGCFVNAEFGVGKAE
ncbi:MAG: malto-oligosyltrehalose synthase, partial [Cytophagales bacterium]|nr:malto-oligosyltrehalose synthase [Cytophagales bacterium]